MKIERLAIAGLTTRIVGDASAQRTVVLLHGFGAPGDDLVALAEFIRAPLRPGVTGQSAPGLGPVRFVFPEAPLELGGLYGDSRAWWLLDLARLEAELRSGAPRDRRGEVPEGLEAARAHLSRFLDQLQARYAIDNSQLVLGGFSQGAMLSLDVALHRDAPPAALILMSGTLLAESVWRPRMKQLAGVPVLQSHGRHDPLLPFPIAELLRDELKAAGANVTWIEFLGGHEIPPPVLDGVTQLLARL